MNSSRQQIQGVSNFSLTKDEFLMTWITESYICRRPRVYFVGKLLRVLYTNFDSSGATYAIKMYDEHDVDILSALTGTITHNTQSQIEIRHEYATGLYGPILVDGWFTFEVVTDSVEMSGAFRVLYERR